MLSRCSRRHFLTAAAGTVAGAALSGSISVLRADSPVTVIDAHTHFYDPTRPQGVPWPAREDKLLYRPVLPKDYRGQAVPRPVAGTIVVEASPWLEDNQWLLDLAARETLIAGLVGNLPVGTKIFAGHLKRFAANPLFRGIRIRDRKLEGTLQEPAFVSDLKLLADYDLSLDLVGGSEILGYADQLAKEVPKLRVIIDHLAGVRVDGHAPPSDWVEQLKELARHPNIYCKLSGLVEGAGRSDGTAPGETSYYRPILNVMRETFGAERLIYASNWPVSERFAPLSTVQSIIEDYFHGYGAREQQQIFSESATHAYRWLKR
jgi:L-fuconolactonase